MTIIESWGRGYKKIQEEFDRVGMLMPSIQEVDGGIMAVIERRSINDIIRVQKESFTNKKKKVENNNVGSLSVLNLSKRHYLQYYKR